MGLKHVGVDGFFYCFLVWTCRSRVDVSNVICVDNIMTSSHARALLQLWGADLLADRLSHKKEEAVVISTPLLLNELISHELVFGRHLAVA